MMTRFCICTDSRACKVDNSENASCGVLRHADGTFFTAAFHSPLLAVELTSRLEALMSVTGQEETSRSTSLQLYGRASVGIALGRRNHEAGAWKMHTDLADRGFAASDDDLMDTRGD